VLCLPEQATRRQQAAILIVCGVLASAPDFPLPLWGHERYDISHSLFVNLALILILISVLWKWRATLGGWRVLLGGSGAWLSHLLLDSFYNHGGGVGIFWPFSTAHLTLPIPWFSVIPTFPPPLTLETARIALIELVSYGVILLLAIGLKRQRFKSTEHVCQTPPA